MRANLVLRQFKRQGRIPLDYFDRWSLEFNKRVLLPIATPVFLLIGIAILMINHWVATTIGACVVMLALFLGYTLACVTDVLNKHPE